MSDLFRVAVTGTVSGEPFANVIYVERASQTAEEICNAVDTYWVDIVRAQAGSNLVFGNITATEVGHLILDPEYFSKPVTKTGSYLGLTNKSDPQLALCLRLHTGLSGRKRRGRVFLAGAPDEWVENGRVVGGWANTIATNLAAAWTGSSPTSGMHLQVFSRKIFEGLTDIILDSYKPVTSITAAPVMSTMRSRKPVA